MRGSIDANPYVISHHDLGVSGLLLIGATGSVAQASRHSDAPDDWLPAVAKSAALSTPVVASGTVAGRDGSGETGALVELRAWPSVDELDAMDEGDQFDLEPVARAVTDNDGHYELRVDPATSLDPYAAKNGSIDLEVVAHTDQRFGVSTFNVVADDSEAAGDTSVATRSATGEVASSAQADISLRGDLDAAGTSAGGPRSVCEEIKNLGPKAVVLGTSHSRASGVKITFTHTQTASSSLGVGVKTGGWHQEGTVSRESTVSTTYPKALGKTLGKAYRTGWTYKKYECVLHNPGPIIWKETRPTNHYGGARKVDVSVINAHHCGPYGPGAKLKMNRATAKNYTGGVKIGDAIGVNLSARTGYSSKTKFLYEATKHRRFCGDTGGPANAERVVNKPR